MNYFFCLYPKSRTVFGQHRLKFESKVLEKSGFQAFFQPNQIASSRPMVELLCRKWLSFSHVSKEKSVSGNSQSDRFRTAPDHSFFKESFINPYKI